MVKDFLKYTNDKQHGTAYMNENTLRAFINQWRVYYTCDEYAMTTDQCVRDIKKGIAFHPTIAVRYNANVPDGYMKVEL